MIIEKLKGSDDITTILPFRVTLRKRRGTREGKMMTMRVNLFCFYCHAELTTTDIEAGFCTQCQGRKS